MKIYLILPWWLKRLTPLLLAPFWNSHGFAYFVGLRPLLKVSIESVRLNSKTVQGAKFKFSTINQIDLDTSFLNESSFKLGAALSNDRGEWSGDVFVPFESKT